MDKFTSSFDDPVYIDAVIDTPPDEQGRFYRAIIKADDARPPWEQNDGHGPVSHWKPVATKRPGERLLLRDDNMGRFYDTQAAMLQAKVEDWDAPPYGTGTPGQRAARAVEADFNYLYAWCHNDWWYCGVALQYHNDPQDPTAFQVVDSLWGLEANTAPGNPYLNEVANDLLRAALKERADVPA